MWQRDGKGRALAVYALNRDGAAHHFQQIAGNRQAKAGAFHGTVALQIGALELGEELSYVFLPDADARIRHRYPQANAPVRSRLCFTVGADLQADAAFFRILDRIVQHIDDHLTNAHLIAIQTVWDGRIHIHDIIQVFVLYPEIDHIADVIDDGAKLITGFNDVHFPRFYLGEIQNVIDDG